MAEAQAPTPAPQSELIDIGTVAAHNIVQQLGLADDKVQVVRDAIRDEIGAMSSHFTLAVADVQTAHEVAVNDLKKKFAADVDANKAALYADFSFVKAHALLVAGTLGLVFVAGVLVGRFV